MGPFGKQLRHKGSALLSRSVRDFLPCKETAFSEHTKARHHLGRRKPSQMKPSPDTEPLCTFILDSELQNCERVNSVLYKVPSPRYSVTVVQETKTRSTKPSRIIFPCFSFWWAHESVAAYSLSPAEFPESECHRFSVNEEPKQKVKLTLSKAISISALKVQVSPNS